MIVKSFVLRQERIDAIVSQCVPGTIAVVRPEKALESLIRTVINEMIVRKQPAETEIYAVKAYLDAVSPNPAYQEKKNEFMAYVEDYLRKAMDYSVPISAVEDFILAKCAFLCAQAVAFSANVEIVDGRELVVCRMDGRVPMFDWAATRSEITYKCTSKDHLVISGGYACTPQGTVLGVGKGGANMMASLVASAVGAEVIEFYVEGEGINGISSMTYDEAAHYCASKTAPFPSAALWPAKRAGIPIVVKSILHTNFAGTRISGTVNESSSAKTISGIVADRNLELVTFYGTGLLGQVGASSTLFSAMAKEGVNIRFIAQSSSEYAISFAVDAKDREVVSEVINGLRANNPMMPLDDVMVVNQEVAILTVYGSRMKNVPGVSGKVFSLLGQAGVNVIASAQGGEELSISVVVEVADIDKAQNALSVLY